MAGLMRALGNIDITEADIEKTKQELAAVGITAESHPLSVYLTLRDARLGQLAALFGNFAAQVRPPAPAPFAPVHQPVIPENQPTDTVAMPEKSSPEVISSTLERRGYKGLDFASDVVTGIAFSVTVAAAGTWYAVKQGYLSAETVTSTIQKALPFLAP